MIRQYKNTILLFVFTINIVFSQSHEWKIQYLGVNQISKSVKAVNSMTAWVCGSEGVFYTSDGGENWVKKMSGSVETIETLNDSSVIVTMPTVEGTKFFRTGNSGLDWENVHFESTYVNGIKMFDQLNGIAIGDPKDSVWRILRTTDSGLTWHFEPGSPKIKSCEAGNINSLTISNKKIVWFGVSGCGGHKIYKSSDMGISWTWHTTPFDDSYGIWFNDSLYGSIAFASGFFYSTNGGVTWAWSNQVIPHSYNVTGTVGKEMWGTSNAAVFRSIDGGITWTEVYKDTSKIFGHLSFISMNGSSYGWITASNGAVIKFKGSLTNLRSQQVKTDEKFVLYQNYPNPFNPETKITYVIPEASNVSISLFDVLGKNVGTLVNKFQEPGTYILNLNALHISSGVYFYQLRSSDVTITKKFIYKK